MGRAYTEGDLIGYGFALERILRARTAPSFPSTIGQ
jgi:hypothetical protein